MQATVSTKWTAGEIGPRQFKAFNGALSSFSWEAKTETEITDYGSSNVTALHMGGGSLRQEAKDLMEEIKQKYNCIVSKVNYQAIIADIAIAQAKLKDTRPVIDRRTTDAERIERERVAAERKAEADAKAAHQATLKVHEYGLKETSAAIKRVLGVLFPATKFSVRSDTYSMGCSIDVTWTDGPRGSQVKPILDLFGTKGFDGMTDMSYSHAAPEWNGHQFRFRGDSARGTRNLSAAVYLAACERYTRETGKPAPEVNQHDGSYAYVVRVNELSGYRYRDSSPWGECEFCGEKHQDLVGVLVDDETVGVCATCHTDPIIPTRDHEGCVALDECSNDSPDQVVTQIAYHKSLEACAIPFVEDWPDGAPEPDNSVRAVVFGILLGEIPSKTVPNNSDGVFQPNVSDGSVTGVDENPSKTLPNNSVTVTENEEHDGVEIRFAAKPERSAIDNLKANRFRWSSRNKCWYHKRTPSALAFARALALG